MPRRLSKTPVHRKPKLCLTDMADASTLQVTKTPGSLSMGRPLKDFGHEQLKALVEEEVKRVYAE